MSLAAGPPVWPAAPAVTTTTEQNAASAPLPSQAKPKTADNPFKERRSRVDALVVDTAALIKGTRLDELSGKLVTVREVISEVRDKRARQALQMVPYELEFREPSPEALLAVSEFAKKTGDYRSLSAVDIRVLALTYMLEKELVGTVDHLRKEPVRKGIKIKGAGAMKKENKAATGVFFGSNKPAQKKAGADTPAQTTGQTTTTQGETGDKSTHEHPESDTQKPEPVEEGHAEGCGHEHEEGELEGQVEGEGEEEEEEEGLIVEHQEGEEGEEGEMEGEEEEGEREEGMEGVTEGMQRTNLDGTPVTTEQSTPSDSTQAPPKPSPTNQSSSTEKAEPSKKGKEVDLKKFGWGSFAEDTGDQDGWITPDNIKKVSKSQFDPFGDTVVDRHVKVACLTTDYAMQNVLIQMGLHVVSIDGMLIRRAKTFVLKCQACFTVTTRMDKQFCASCGNATLFKVSASIDRNGVTHYMTRANTKVNLRGTKYSIPKPQSGRNAHNLILREDQREYEMAKKKRNDKGFDVFSEDFISAASPFKDKYQHEVVIGYGKKNPNTVKRTGNRKKKHSKFDP
eukprot:comp19436_c0_seq1/m.22565 comp19436_c0_seq1/g.22565  ORF comp19436_c0_seq1/g.22565 comp19436_c0_seq1/m.22565 type:complete len:567 (-) comp19436_c0_seq1:550-2250(-)